MKSLDRLIRALRRLPGVGPRQAERFSSYFLKAPQSEAEEFINALLNVRENIKLCPVCYAYSEHGMCKICSDPSREQNIICVVEGPEDIEAVEKTSAFKGLYHVLHGSISPLDGRGAGTIKIKELIDRVANSQTSIDEVIIATDPDTEGENTALYIANELKNFNTKVTRIGYGVPLGGDIDYIDEMTLMYSLKSRTKI